MFDVGFSELLIIAVVALIVLGPERMPKAARFAGLWVRKARAQWYSVKSELEFELAQEDMKKHVQDFEHSIKAPMQELQNDMQQAQADIQSELDGVTVSAQTFELDPEPTFVPALETDGTDETDDAIQPNPQQGKLW